MAIKRHKRGGRVYLAEYKSVRVGKKVISKFVRYIGPKDEQNDSVKPKRKVLDRLQLNRSYRSGDVKLLWSIAKDLGFLELIDNKMPLKILIRRLFTRQIAYCLGNK